jgi:hypothetical protein
MRLMTELKLLGVHLDEPCLVVESEQLDFNFESVITNDDAARG